MNVRRGVLRVRAENAKDGEARDVLILGRLPSVLAMLRHDPAGREHPPEAYVFGNAVGEQVKDPKKAWETTVLRANGHTPSWIKGKLSAESRARLRAINLHFHDLRHEAASRLLERGMPLQDVQQMLGHASAEQTSTYCNTTLDHMKASAKRLKPDTAPALHEVAQAAVPSVGYAGNDDRVEVGKWLVN